MEQASDSPSTDTQTAQRAFHEAFSPLVLIEDRSIVWLNPAASALFGAQVDKLRTDLFDAWAPLGPRGCVAEPRYVTVDSVAGTCRCRSSVVDLSNGGLEEERWLIILQPVSVEDLTSRELEEDWFATVAHDLRNPLGAIFGYADTLLDTPIGVSLNEKQRELVARIRSSGQRAIELLRNAQLLTHLGNRPTAAPARDVLDLGKTIRTVVDTTWREDPTTPLVEVRLPEGPIPVVLPRVDAERIVANLFLNALKFAVRGSTVTVEAGISGSHAEFSVTNLGKPIAPEERGKLFGKFSRLSNSRGTPGTGLGLYIVRSLVERSRGTVSVDADEAGKIRFRVRIPLATRQ
jgi:signal transduction histidine kinase